MVFLITLIVAFNLDNDLIFKVAVEIAGVALRVIRTVYQFSNSVFSTVSSLT